MDGITITLLIVGVTILTSWRAFNDKGLFERLKHYPYEEARDKEYYRFLSSGFVHGSAMHLFINMYVLYTFGAVVEQVFVEEFGSFGRILFVIFYLTAIVIADIPTYMKHKNNPTFASIGASGAVSAIVFVYIIYYPWHGLTFIFFPFISFPAIVLGLAYLIYSSWASKNSRDQIDHSAHFAGAIYGIVFMFASRPSLLSEFIFSIRNGLPF